MKKVVLGFLSLLCVGVAFAEWPDGGGRGSVLNDAIGGASAGPVFYGGTSGTLAQDSSLYWDASNDRLGIGTTAPGQALDVQGNIASTGSIILNGSVISKISTSASSMTFQTNGGNSFVLDTSSINYNTSDWVIVGNKVGIGTTNPTQKLSILGTAGSATTDILLVSSGTQVQMDINVTDSSGGFGYIGTNSNHVWLARTNSAEIFRVTTDRAVMWNTGTSTPTAVAAHAGLAAITTAGSAELKAIDAAGNVTQISPHNPKTGEWYFQSCNSKTGRCVQVDLERFFKEYDEKNGTRFFTESIPLE